MAESAGDRTEAPTPQRLRKAREEGQVAQSRDLTGGLVLLAAFGVLSMQASSIGHEVVQGARTCFQQATRPDLDTSIALLAAATAAKRIGLVAVPVLLAAVGVGVAVSFLQVGPLLTLKPLTPKLEKLNPIEGLKQKLLSRRAFVELGKNVLKFGIAGILAAMLIRGRLTELSRVGSLSPDGIGAWTWGFVSSLAFSVLSCFVLLSILDLLFQRWQWMKDLRMSKQEVKESYKEEEGNPEYKAKRRQMHEEVSTAQMLMAVPEADVVVTNPDHLAVALRWDPEKDGAPRVIAKGADHIAERIKEVARKNGVPIDRRESLARTLYSLRLSEEIPEDLFNAVIAVLEWAEEEAGLYGRTPNWRKSDAGQQDQQDV